MTSLAQVYAIAPDNTLYALTSPAAGWYLVGVSGLHMDDVQPVDARTPYSDGTRMRGVYVPSRTVVLLLACIKSSASALEYAVSERVSILSPRRVSDFASQHFTLRIITMDGRTRDLDGVFTKVAATNDGPLYAEVEHIFYAPDGYFYDPQQRIESVAMPAGEGFSFPLSVPASFASTTITGRVYPNNRGDVHSWPVIRVYGPCDNPVLTNETLAKTIRLTQSQDVDDYIEIDMDAGTVVWWDNSAGTLTSILETLSADSEFWPLAVGENSIYITADGAPGGQIQITWYDRFISV